MKEEDRNKKSCDLFSFKKGGSRSNSVNPFGSLENNHVNVFVEVYLLKCVGWHQGVIWSILFDILPFHVFLIP